MRAGLRDSWKNQTPQTTVSTGATLLNVATWLASRRRSERFCRARLNGRDQQGKDGQADPGARRGAAEHRQPAGKGDQGDGKLDEAAHEEGPGEDRQAP